MKFVTFTISILAASILGAQSPAFAENPLFMPMAETSPPLMTAAEVEGLKKEAEGLKRKAELLKTAANKKYAASSDLRKKAGGFRSDAFARGEALRSQAEQSAAVSGFIGDMFGIMAGMGGGGLSSNGMFAQAMTGQMIKGMQTIDAKGVADAHGQSGQMAMDADKKAGPLEMRADELENDGNRLMEAHNRLIGIANAKSLLVAADELLKKIDGDNRHMEQLKESHRAFVASMATP